MTGRQLDNKAGRRAEKRPNRNKSHRGPTTDTIGIQPSAAFTWLMSESGRGDNQGLKETDKGVSNPNLNHPPVFTFPFQPSFSPSGAVRPETKPVIKQTPVRSGFTFSFPSPFSFQPSFSPSGAERPETKPVIKQHPAPSEFTFPFQPSLSPSGAVRPETKPAVKQHPAPSEFTFPFQPSFSPPSAVRPEKEPIAQEPSFPSLFIFQQPRQTARTTDFVFGAAHTKQGGMETTERPGEMKTGTTQNTGNKKEKEPGDQEEPSAANSRGGGHRGARGGGETTEGSTDPREDQDSNEGMCRCEGAGAPENGADVTDDRKGNETGAARHVPAGDQGKGAHQGGVDRAADHQRETVENGSDTPTIAADETDQQRTAAEAPSPDEDSSDAEDKSDTYDDTTDSADSNVTVIERQPKENPDASSDKGASTENGRDPAQDRSPDDADVGNRTPPLTLPTIRPTGYRTPAPPRGLGRGRGRGHAVTPDSGIASPDVGGQPSPLIREIHTMLSSVLEGQPDRDARRQLFPGESAAGMQDYLSEIHRKYAAIKQVEQETQHLRDELAKLEGKLSDKDKAIRQLQADREGAGRSTEKKMAALQGQLAKRDEVITDLKRERDHLNENIQSLEKELKTREYDARSLATIGNMLAEERLRAEQLESEKVELADDMKKLGDENHSMQGRLKEHDRTVSSLKLQKLLWKAVTSKQNSSLDSRRDVSQSQETLKEQLDSFAREREDLNSQVTRLTSQLARAEEQAESHRTTAEEQTVAVCQLSEVRTGLEAEIATMRKRAEVAENKATRHEQEVSTLTLCRDRLNTQKTVAEEYVMELSRQMAPLQAERAQFQVLYCQKQDELDATTARKDARIEELTAQLSEAEQMAMPLKLDAQRASLQAQQARAQLESIQQQFEQYKDEISTGDAAQRKANAREEQLQSRISQQEAQKKRYLQEKEQSDRQVKLLKDEVKRLRRRCQGGEPEPNQI